MRFNASAQVAQLPLPRTTVPTPEPLRRLEEDDLASLQFLTFVLCATLSVTLLGVGLQFLA